MSKTLLVTGAGGFIGRHTGLEASRQGYTVVGLGHGSVSIAEQVKWGLASWFEGEVNLPNLTELPFNFDVIIHAAGGGSVADSFASPNQDFERSVVSTSRLLEYIRTVSPGSKLVFPSSAAVYGVAMEIPQTVDSPITPVSPYGVHKLMSEQLCASYALSFGVSVSIVRVFSAYGPYLRKQLMWDACNKILGGSSDFGGTGEETRDWIHVNDVARLLLEAGNHADSSASIVNGASGIETTNKDLLGFLFKMMGTDMQPEFTATHRPGDPSRYAGDISQAQKWNWQPRKTWESGVREYVKWFRSEKV